MDKITILNKKELNKVVGGIEIGQRIKIMVQYCTVCGYIKARWKGARHRRPEGYCKKCKKPVKFDILTEEEYNRRFGK